MDEATMSDAERLARLIPENFPNHPVIAWYEGLTNGVSGGDCSVVALPIPGLFHVFRRRSETAYLWRDDSGLLLSPWHSMSRREGRTIRSIGSVEEALDQLNTLPHRRGWRF